MLQDTIAAVSTPRGKGGVALIRISGPDAVSIASAVFEPKNGMRLGDSPVRTALYGTVWSRDTQGSRTAIDEALATVFRAPASFTGEDTVEITCHGGILLTETVLTALLAAGAKPAGPGEFTKRAFLNGKIGLSSAEALADLLEAQNREQLILAHGAMGGKTEKKSDGIYRQMKHLLASVYAVIDYPDEDLADLSREEMIDRMGACLEQMRQLADTYRTGHAVAEGIRTVICGKPNVGKSSLFNRLLGRDAAIVTDVEGTTRDLLTDTALLGRVTLRLTDTAGMHETEDKVEQIGVKRAQNELRGAELIFALFDGSMHPTEEDRQLAMELSKCSGTVVAIINKNDIGFVQETEDFCHTFSKYVIRYSTLTGYGENDLSSLVETLFVDGKLDIGQDAVLTNARQHAAVIKAIESAERAKTALEGNYPIDFCCQDIEEAMESLAELDGRAVSEDIISEIFSHFCVGK